MRVTKFSIFICLLLITSLFQVEVHAQEDKNLYHKALKHTEKGDTDLAFMNFYRLINNFPESRYYREALFATGEYYFSIGVYTDAAQTFNQFINNYSGSEAHPFAIVYLIEIAKKDKQENLEEKLKKELLGSQQVSLLFRDFIELEYSSSFSKDYLALYFIDKVKIYIDDELFTEIVF